MIRALAFVLALNACGRFGFDATGDGDGGPDGPPATGSWQRVRQVEGVEANFFRVASPARTSCSFCGGA